MLDRLVHKRLTFMKQISVRTLIVLAIACHPLAVSAQGSSLKKQPKDVVLSTRSVTGKLTGFETGDYVHAIIVPKKGEEVSAYLHGYGLEYFLAVYANKPGVFTVQTVKSYIEEAGGVIEIDRITSAKFGKVTFASWWKATRKAMTADQIDKKCQQLVRKLNKGS